MPDEITIAPTSQAPAETPKSSDEPKRSGNVSVVQVAQMLLKRGAQAAAKNAPGAEHATPPAAKPVETAPTPAPVEAPAAPSKTEGQASAAVSTETATTAEPDDVPSQSTSLSPELQAVIDKRIGKEVGRRKAIEEENARLKEQLQKVQQPERPATPSADQPLANINDVQSLVAQQNEIKEIKRWAQSQLITDAIDRSGHIEAHGRQYTKADLHAIVLNADRVLEDQIPQRYQFLQARQQAEQQALDRFPWMHDRASEEYQLYQATLKKYPFLQALPDAPVVVGVQITGARYLEQQAKATAEAKAKPVVPVVTKTTPPASQVAAGAAPGAIRESGSGSAQKAMAAEIERLKKSGNVTAKDVAKVLQQQELSKR